MDRVLYLQDATETLVGGSLSGRRLEDRCATVRRMSLPAQRAFVEYRHNAEHAPGHPYRDATAGWFYLVYHAWIPTEVYRMAQAERAVDGVYADAGLDWPASSPTSRS